MKINQVAKYETCPAEEFVGDVKFQYMGVSLPLLLKIQIPSVFKPYFLISIDLVHWVKSDYEVKMSKIIFRFIVIIFYLC